MGWSIETIINKVTEIFKSCIYFWGPIFWLVPFKYTFSW